MFKLTARIEPGRTADSLQRELGRFTEQVMADVLITARSFTPRRSGAAARNWRRSGTGTASVVSNHTAYIERLEAGSSRQAPRGITQPTLNEISKRNK